jgi:hypothetical protein
MATAREPTKCIDAECQVRKKTRVCAHTCVRESTRLAQRKSGAQRLRKLSKRAKCECIIIEKIESAERDAPARADALARRGIVQTICICMQSNVEVVQRVTTHMAMQKMARYAR